MALLFHNSAEYGNIVLPASPYKIYKVVMTSLSCNAISGHSGQTLSVDRPLFLALTQKFNMEERVT